MAAVEPTNRAERRRRGAWYTPDTLVRFLVEQAVEPATNALAPRRGLARVLDPACGDGRLLTAAGAAASAAGVPVELVGMEVDAVAAALARGTGAQVLVGDGRRVDPGGRFDVVIGNPPYLGQLAAATSRGGRSALGGGPYADVAAEFLLRAVALARPDGGRVALVLPQSILASRDTAPVRAAVLRAASVVGLWWVGGRVFDAEVNVCVLVLQRGVPQSAVRRWSGAEPRRLADAPAAALSGPTWSPLVADLAGVPALDLDESHGRLGDLATATAGFRDQYYGLVPFVRDGGLGPPLVTAGLIDAGRCAWGERPARFGGRRFGAPRVDLSTLTRVNPRLGTWFERQLRPKVLVATQTRVIEAVADPAGAWLPSVPVIAVQPRSVDDLWTVAAVLTAPPVAAWALQHHVGAGLGASALKLRAAEVLELPLPSHPSPDAARLLEDGDVEACASTMCAAYGLGSVETDAVFPWWRAGATAGTRRRPSSTARSSVGV